MPTVGALLPGAAAPQPGTDAQQQQLSSADLQQRLRRTFLNSLRDMDDASLAAFMGSPEGQRAANLLQYYASHHAGSVSSQKSPRSFGPLLPPKNTMLGPVTTAPSVPLRAEG